MTECGDLLIEAQNYKSVSYVANKIYRRSVFIINFKMFFF